MHTDTLKETQGDKEPGKKNQHEGRDKGRQGETRPSATRQKEPTSAK